MGKSYASEVGRRIAEARERAGLTQIELAVKSGLLDANQISRYERGKAVPLLQHAAALATALRVSLEWLAGAEQSTPVAFYEWAESASGQAATSDARAFLKHLNLHGYSPSVLWYHLAHQAFLHGLSASDVVLAATTTERHAGD